jgi:hypothetical protein
VGQIPEVPGFRASGWLILALDAAIPQLAEGLLWWWVLLIGLSVILGWLLGDWHSAWSVVQTIGLIIAGLTFVYLIVAGFVELRDRNGRRQD